MMTRAALGFKVSKDSIKALLVAAARMIERTKIISMGPRVESPPDLVYSTSPLDGEGQNGKRYIIKRPDIEIVFAEVAGCTFAREVGLSVPDVAVFEGEGDDIYAGSEKVATAGRTIDPWLFKHPEGVVNLQDLFSAIVVDVWLANIDRNIGNFTCEAIGQQEG